MDDVAVWIGHAVKQNSTEGYLIFYEYHPSNMIIMLCTGKKIIFCNPLNLLMDPRVQKIVTETSGARGSHPDCCPPPIRRLLSPDRH